MDQIEHRKQINSAMARTKNTKRKTTEPNRPPAATKPFKCRTCGKEFGQSTNYARHMGLVHKLTTMGEEIDSATLARYASYAKRGRREPNEPNQSSEHTSAPSAEDDLAAYAEPDEPDTPPLLPKTCKGKKVKRLRGRRIRSKEGTANTSSDAELAFIRKPTKPDKPSCRRIKSRPELEFIPMPRRTDAKPRTKRQMEMAPSVLAKKVASYRTQTSREIAEQMASTYGMPSLERRHNENIIRGMRAAERNLCVRIRQSLPLNRTPADIEKFLDKLEVECRQAEEHDSDEFV